MSLIDNKLLLFDNTDVSGVATTETISDNVFQIDGLEKYLVNNASGDPVNLSAAVDDIGRKAKLVVEVGDTGFYATGGTATLDIKLYEHTTATVTSGSAVISVNIPGIVVTTPAAHVAAGVRLFEMIVPPDLWGDTTNYFIGLSALVNTNTITAGTLNAWIERLG